MNRLYTLILLPLRVVAVLLLTLLGLSVQLALFWCVSRSLARAIVKFWSLGMLYCLGVKTIVSSDPGVVNTGVDVPQNQAALYVCNHVSWLDILAVQATAPVVFVAKSEIRSWPVLGWMVSLAGTCFIHRERRTALRGVHSPDRVCAFSQREPPATAVKLVFFMRVYYRQLLKLAFACNPLG
jgi:1-acyl-sn-glycerol-3-phosphate acyltransferase